MGNQRQKIKYNNMLRLYVAYVYPMKLTSNIPPLKLTC